MSNIRQLLLLKYSLLIRYFTVIVLKVAGTNYIFMKLEALDSFPRRHVLWSLIYYAFRYGKSLRTMVFDDMVFTSYSRTLISPVGKSGGGTCIIYWEMCFLLMSLSLISGGCRIHCWGRSRATGGLGVMDNPDRRKVRGFSPGKYS